MNKSAIWAIGFRPFFLMGSLISALLVIYWAVVYYNGTIPIGYFDPIHWHAHEMIYGFAVAIVAGFLLTASAAWTKTKAVSGTKLKVLFALWFLGRLAFILSILELPLPFILYFMLDMLFIPVLVVVLAPSLLSARKLKNIQFLLVLSILAIGNLLMHLSSLEMIDASFATKGIYLGVNLILLILIVISGRIVPMFTMNAMPHLKLNKFEMIEKLIIFSACVFILLDFLDLGTVYTAWAALLAGVLNLVRLLGWKSWQLKGNPLVWILHLGYFWIVIGFFLVFISDLFELMPRSIALHCFTAGAMGTFIIGMMSRVSLGHTGRPLILPPGFVISYLLITLSAVVRVGVGFYPEFYGQGILYSGIFWGISFVIYLAFFFTILISPRPDHRPG